MTEDEVENKKKRGRKERMRMFSWLGEKVK